MRSANQPEKTVTYTYNQLTLKNYSIVCDKVVELFVAHR